MSNPFTHYTPETLKAQMADQLFVELHSDISKVKTPGHAMILGARGSGKSMLIRCLLPDVLRLKGKCKLSELDFLAFHIPIRNTQLNITDILRLDKQNASYIINEHFLTLNVLMNVLSALSQMQFDIPFNETEYNDFFTDIYLRNLKLCGNKTIPQFVNKSANDFFHSLFSHSEEMYSDLMQYILAITNNEDRTVPYNLPILSYLRFLVPIISGLKSLPDFPNKNIYLFIDDADNLSLTQTKILNSWLASRTQPDISLKISSQYAKYKTFVSTTGVLVEAPHDYAEINISEIYTTQSSLYAKTVEQILDRRLEIAGIKINSRNYFPVYGRQEKKIEKIKQEIRNDWEINGRGNRASDDVLRYAIPDYIKSLGGKKKSSSKYFYAGLETIIHLSSGVIRYVLDVASLMYDSTIKSGSTSEVPKLIPHTIQHSIVKEKANKLLLSQFRNLGTLEPTETFNLNNVSKLQNLLFAMGQTFHEILISNRSERKVFSIALSNMPTKEISDVFDFGIQTGFLHLSSIGNKDGTGRTWLYILNRSLAPFFILDPSGFAGYLFVTNENLLQAMNTGKKLRDIDDSTEIIQPSLF
jgi:hypothetical protein